MLEAAIIDIEINKSHRLSSMEQSYLKLMYWCQGNEFRFHKGVWQRGVAGIDLYTLESSEWKWNFDFVSPSPIVRSTTEKESIYQMFWQALPQKISIHRFRTSCLFGLQNVTKTQPQPTIRMLETIIQIKKQNCIKYSVWKNRNFRSLLIRSRVCGFNLQNAVKDNLFRNKIHLKKKVVVVTNVQLNSCSL